jgi:hypothetical protein
MMVELLAPGVEDSETSQLRSKVLRVTADILEGLGHGVKEQAIEDTGILEGQRTEGMR